MASVSEYYNNKTVFITGATGFIGNVLVEKLLRSCPEIRGVCCLVRPKRGCSADVRLKKMFDKQLFSKLRSEQPDFTEKVHIINGDMMDDDLGIGETDRQYIADNVNVVFHLAATIKFDEPLKLAIQMNVLGMRKMIHLCKAVKNLEAFIHVSTAYANCDRKYIDEVIYPPPVDPQKLIDTIEWLDEDVVNMITPKLIGDKPNTYTYTKHIAESLLVDEGGDLPYAIVRPSIVTAVSQDPLPGWIDNWNGPSGMCIAIGKGILRVVKGEYSAIADFIPADFPVNLMIAAAWQTATGESKRNGKIFQITTGELNPHTWGEMCEDVIRNTKTNPMESCFMVPSRIILRTNRTYHFLVKLKHMLPAYAADFFCRMLGKKARMLQTYDKLHHALDIFEFFASRTWKWTHTNVDLLKSCLSPQEQKIFYFDPREIEWHSYISDYYHGTKAHVLKETPDGLPAARAHLKKLRNYGYIFNLVSLIVIWRVLIARSKLARSSWYFITGLIFKFVQFLRISSSKS